MERVDPVVAAELPAAALRQQLESLVHEIAGRERIEISAREQAQIAQELADDMVGYGPLEPLLADDSISDIMVNGPDRVFIEVRGRVQQTDIRFRSAAQLAAIAQKMAATVGRRVDESSPLVDCRLADGSRVNVVFPPLAIDGACISIRKFAKRKVDLHAMAAGGSMSSAVARVLEIAARCRLNVVISGGTGSGKTTMMNAMSRLIDHGGCGGAAIAAAACGAAGNPPGEPGRPRRDHPARPDQERAAHAPRPHHRGRGARRRGLRHAAGDEHRA
jgi:pilus assembly protein CpaF